MIGYKKPLKSDMLGHKKPLDKNMMGHKMPLENLENVVDVTKKLEQNKKTGGLERAKRNLGSTLGQIDA
jgi:hypothetical protein